MENTEHSYIQMDITSFDIDSFLKKHDLLDVATRMANKNVLMEVYAKTSSFRGDLEQTLAINAEVKCEFEPAFKSFEEFQQYALGIFKKSLVNEILEKESESKNSINKDVNESLDNNDDIDTTTYIYCHINVIFQKCLAIIAADANHFNQRKMIEQGYQPFDWLKSVQFV